MYRSNNSPQLLSHNFCQRLQLPGFLHTWPSVVLSRQRNSGVPRSSLLATLVVWCLRYIGRTVGLGGDLLVSPLTSHTHHCDHLFTKNVFCSKTLGKPLFEKWSIKMGIAVWEGGGRGGGRKCLPGCFGALLYPKSKDIIFVCCWLFGSSKLQARKTITTKYVLLNKCVFVTNGFQQEPT